MSMEKLIIINEMASITNTNTTTTTELTTLYLYSQTIGTNRHIII